MLRLFVILSLAAVPFAYSARLMDPEQSIRFAYLTITGFISLFALWRMDEQKMLQAFAESISIRNPVFAGMLLLFICTLISVYTAQQKTDAYAEAARVTCFLFFYMWVTTMLKAQPKAIGWLSIGVCAMGCLLSLFALSDFFVVWNRLDDPKALYDMTGRMGHRNLLAIALALCLPFHMIVLERYHSKWWRMLLSLNLLLLIAALTLTSSRVGWLALIMILCSAMVWFFVGYKKGIIARVAFQRTLLMFIICTGVFISGIALYALKDKETAKNLNQRLTSFFNYKESQNEHTETIRERLRLWGNTAEIIKDHPIAGVGAGNWKFHFPGKGMDGIRSENGVVHFQQPHNDFLWVWVETGIIGLLAFLFIFIAAFALIFKRMRATHDVAQFILLAATSCGLAAYLVASGFDFPKERPVHLFLLACYLAIASFFLTHENRISTKTGLRALWGATLLLMLTVSIFWGMRAFSETHLKEGLIARSRGNYAELVRQLEKINPRFFEVDLTGTPLDWYKGEAAFYQSKPEVAKQYFEQALEANPYHLYTLSNIGTIYCSQGDTAKALEYWNKALSFAPGFADANLNIAVVHYNRGELPQAMEMLSHFRIQKVEIKHDALIAAIMSEYVLSLEQDAAPELKGTMQKMAQDEAWLVLLQDKLAAYRPAPAQMIWGEAIFAAEKLDKTLNVEKADSLRKIYDL